MISFHCKKCGKKIKVPEEQVGKKGRCPKCRTIVVVPKPKDVAPAISQSVLDSEKQPETPAPVDDTTQKHEAESPKTSWDDAFAKTIEEAQDHDDRIQEQQEKEQEQTEHTGQRKLPWFIDFFLYPTSLPGLINMGIFSLLPVLLIVRRLSPVPFIWSFLTLIITVYMYYYFVECIYDSAAGGIRSPRSIPKVLEISDVFLRLFSAAGCFFVVFGPVLLYFGFTKKIDIFFWLLITYAVFFFPMTLLAAVTFDFTRGFSTLLWFMSIFKTFLQYIGLVLIVCALVGLVVWLASVFHDSRILAFIVSVLFIYLTMLVAHLFGRFYWRYKEKLNWEV
ncbi:MAG: zinc ribbon domain-containing protein [Planctomycetota bacterium]|jgi:DNA-directed RNA polymerase subunit RPC12/RpoP